MLPPRSEFSPIAVAFADQDAMADCPSQQIMSMLKLPLDFVPRIGTHVHINVRYPQIWRLTEVHDDEVDVRWSVRGPTDGGPDGHNGIDLQIRICGYDKLLHPQTRGGTRPTLYGPE
jgi:hypothetical protein